MIKVTEIAAEKLRGVIARSKNPEAAMVRIAFGGYG